MLKEKIENLIKIKFINSDIKIFTNDDKHFNIQVVSDLFEFKDLIDRQKMLYDVIKDYILTKEIHAVSFKTYTYEEFNNLS